MSTLGPHRRFYRAYLAQYAWARLLKRACLALRVNALQARHWLVWHSRRVARQGLWAVAVRINGMRRYIDIQAAHQVRHYVRWHVQDKAHGLMHKQERSAVRRFYRRHLERFALARFLKRMVLRLRDHALEARNVVVWQVQRHLPQAFRASLSPGTHFYAMRTFAEHQALPHVQTRVLAVGREVIIDLPTVYPESYRASLFAGVWPLNVPPVSAFEVNGATVMGKSDLIYCADQCLHHGMYDFRRDQLVEEMHGLVTINHRRGALARLGGRAAGRLPAAISMLGSASPNYVHWLTETAPKLALIDALDAYRDVPLLIDAGLHPNIMESAHLLNARARPVITLAPGDLLTVDRLIAVSPVAYIPFDFKPGLKLDKLHIDPGFACYAPDGLNRVRSQLVERVAADRGPGRTRLFLRRAGKSRQMSNADEVEALVRELGFDIVEPETLSFTEQVRLFSRAEVILGQGGAAFGNILFAPAGCHVIILSTWSPYTIYYYFSNLAAVLGQRCSFLLCDAIDDINNPHRAHKGLRVPIPALRQVIES